MTEPILLFIATFVLGIALMVYRRYRQLSSRKDALLRYTSMFAAALAIHLYKAEAESWWWFITAVAVNAATIYGITHLADRIFTGGAGVLNKLRGRPSRP